MMPTPRRAPAARCHARCHALRDMPPLTISMPCRRHATPLRCHKVLLDIALPPSPRDAASDAVVMLMFFDYDTPILFFAA